ncbi:MAG: hypothetical protein R3Y11_00400 [Pseudomonadota bacterium]
MNQDQSLIQCMLTRQEAFTVFMRRNGYSFVTLALELGLTASAARQISLAQTINSRRHQALVNLGFPAEILPEVQDPSERIFNKTSNKSLPFFANATV